MELGLGEGGCRPCARACLLSAVRVAVLLSRLCLNQAHRPGMGFTEGGACTCVWCSLYAVCPAHGPLIGLLQGRH